MDKPKQSKVFGDFVSTLNYLEVCRITVTPAGKFEVPSETDGRICQVDLSTRKQLAKFCREFAKRLETGAHDRRRDRGAKRAA
jgi:hypothetical protein